MDEQTRKEYNRSYYKNTLAAKRKAAAAAKKLEKLKEEAQRELAQRASTSTAEATKAALLRMHERECRDANIVMELFSVQPGTPLEDSICDDGSSYLAWFRTQVQGYLKDVKMAVVPCDFGALWNALSMDAAGRALLHYFFSIAPLPDASWERYKFVPKGADGEGIIRTITNPPDNIAVVESAWKGAQGLL